MRTCYIAGSRSHAFNAQASKDVVLAAEDEVTRQRCMRIIEAAGTDASPLQNIASAMALTRDLLDMNCLSAIKAVLTALGVPMSDPSLNSVGLDLPSLKAAGFDAAAFVSCEYDWATIKRAGFSVAEVKAAGCNAASAIGAGYDLPSLKAGGFNATTLKLAGCSFSALVLARFSAEELTEAGFSSEVQVFHKPLLFMMFVEFCFQPQPICSGCRSGASAQDSRRRTTQGCCGCCPGVVFYDLSPRSFFCVCSSCNCASKRNNFA